VTYTFDHVFPPAHFVTRYIEYAAKRTDAAYEYHEALALVALAAATPRLTAKLAPYPRGLATNLYVLLVGDSTTSRKSTALSIAKDILDRALPEVLLPDHFSPEGFVEALAAKSNQAAVWTVDEFSEILDKLHHARYLAGLRGLLLTLYGERNYTYRRHSKRKKGGDKEEDVDRIQGVFFSLAGATTPAIFEILTIADVTTGLLPRFALVMPERKPARKPFFDMVVDLDSERNELVSMLAKIAKFCFIERKVEFEHAALHLIDDFAAEVEAEAGAQDGYRAMVDRLLVATLKIAMLCAAGRPEVAEAGAAVRVLHAAADGGQGEPVCVTVSDAEVAVKVARKLKQSATRFARRIGETQFERYVQKALEFARKKANDTTVSRRDVARALHLSKRVIDEIEETLLDRGIIRVEEVNTGGRPGVAWRLLE